MEMELDFSTLTDDQLIELIRQAVAEAIRRGEATAQAAYTVGQEGAEEMRIKQAAVKAAAAAQAAREQAQAEAKAKQEAAAQAERERWTKRGKLALAFQPALQELSDWTLNVWERGTDKRVYLERRGAKACLYVTGNNKQPPGTLEMEQFEYVVPGLRREMDIERTKSRWNSETKQSETYTETVKEVRVDDEAVAAFRAALLPAMQRAGKWGAGLRLDLGQAAAWLAANS